VKIEVEVFRVVTPCSVVVGYQRFRGPCCFYYLGPSIESKNYFAPKEIREYFIYRTFQSKIM
jgi:hypothetical protein